MGRGSTVRRVRLVLLHALPLDGSMWPTHLCPPDDPVLSPTLYGFGKTGAWASGVLDVAGRGPLVLVGNSIGGSCALEVARLAPDRVRLIVLIGAKAAHRPEPELRDAAVRLLYEQGVAEAWDKYWQPLFAPNADPNAVEAGRRIAFNQDVDDVVRGVRVFHSRPDLSDFVRTWSESMLVVSGEHDRTVRHGAEFAGSAPNGTFRHVEGAGHYVSLERPTELMTILRQASERLPRLPRRRI